MRKKIITTYVVIFILIIIVLAYYFLFNIYGNIISIEPKNFYADSSSEIQIEVVPINALGTKALFRTLSAEFEIIEGKDLVEIIRSDEQAGKIKIRSIGKAGIVGIKIKVNNSLLPDYVEVEILPLTA